MQQQSPYLLQRPSNTSVTPFQLAESFALPQEDEFHLGEYWNIIRRRLWLIVGILAAAELLTALLVLTMTPLYSATSTILIERQTPQVLESKNPQVEQSQDSDNFYKTQYEMLKSRSLAAEVIHTLNLDKNKYIAGPPPKPGVFSWITRHCTFC